MSTPSQQIGSLYVLYNHGRLDWGLEKNLKSDLSFTKAWIVNVKPAEMSKDYFLSYVYIRR